MYHPSLRVKVATISTAAILIALWSGLYFYWSNYYQNRAYPGTNVGTINLSGSTSDQAKGLIDARTENILNSGINFKHNDQDKALSTSDLSFSSESSFPILVFENDKTIATVFNGENNRGFLQYLLFLLKTKTQKTTEPVYQLDEGLVRSWLEQNFTELNIAPQNAYFSLEEDGMTIKKNPEQAGQSLDYEQALIDLKVSLNQLENPNITLKTIPLQPEVSIGDLAGWEEAVLEIIDNNGISLALPKDETTKTMKKTEWLISPSQLITWIKTEFKDREPRLSLDETKIITFLLEKVAPSVEREAVLPRLEMSGGKVVSWQTGQPGYQLNATSSAQSIITDFTSGTNKSTLITEEMAVEDISSANDFQIKDLLGTGHSKFSGSSANRRHNIRTGADALHGLLIKPGEEFSLLRALGEIDASSGYLPELVIKGNKTIPEYGGGLCQIGTTVFRGALDTGLPITQRRNHSYRVSYYEPAGTDATIYDPAPDFRFLNDTGNYVLIQARISGDDLYFDFWGVHDGREASVTAPVIYNIVKPAPTKIVETDTLAPGVKKCTESAHSGADAYFDYTVIYPEGSTTTPVQTRRLSSHYVPWQAVCLVGKAKEVTATTTEEIKQPETPTTENATTTIEN
jgi:vancomycin resistance protein YoaR